MTRFPREFYIPKTGTPTEYPAADAIVYTYTMAGKAYAMGFVAKRAKPAFHYSYRSEENRTTSIARWVSDQTDAFARINKYREERKTERAKPHNLEVGHILYASWGYDQTNIDFYEVTRIVGQHTVEIREIGQTSNETGYLCGQCYPKLGAYRGEPEIRRANASGQIKLKSYKWASVWDGQSKYWSAYA